MPFHLAAYTNTALGTVANTDIAALTDDVLSIQSSHFQLRRMMKLIAAWAGSATLIRARLDSPTIRLIANPFIRPINFALLPTDDPNWMDLLDQPLTIPAGEELALQATAAPGTTEVFTGLAWLTEQLDPTPPGNAIWTRATSTTAAVANVWTTVALTWDTAFPAGLYGIVGSEVISTNGIAHRWMFDDQVYRPGMLSMSAASKRTLQRMYRGDFGLFGRFNTTSLPRLQVLVNGTDAAHTIFVKMVRLAG